MSSKKLIQSIAIVYQYTSFAQCIALLYLKDSGELLAKRLIYIRAENTLMNTSL